MDKIDKKAQEWLDKQERVFIGAPSARLAVGSNSLGKKKDKKSRND